MAYSVMRGPSWWIVVNGDGEPVPKARVLSARTAGGEAVLHKGATPGDASLFDIEVDGVRHERVPLRRH